MCRLCGHEVARDDGAQDNGIVVGAPVSHHADGSHIRERGKILTEILLQAGVCNLLTIDRIRVLDDPHFLRRDLADNADAEPWARERLAIHEIIRDAKFAPRRAHFVLKEKPQRFDNLLKVHMVGQTADIMMRLNDRRLPETALNHVRIDRSLYEEVYRADFMRRFFKHADKFRADDLALLLGLRNTFELFIEPLLRIDADINDSVKEDDAAALEEETKTLSELFKKVLNKENLTVKVEKLKNENVSSMMTVSEESRRMQEMMKMYNMYGMDPSMFGGQETLILNANNKLVQYVLENGDTENTNVICEQLYDLAVLSHRQLTPEEMTKFVTRSNDIMMMLAK